MSLTKSFIQEVDQTSREQWENLLKTELKLEDVKTKLTKNSSDGAWPILSLNAPVSVQLPTKASWKKASQTYVKFPSDFESAVQDDLAHGVRIFFLEKEFIEQDQLDRFFVVLNSFATASELEVFLLGDRKLSVKSSAIKVIDESLMVLGRGAFAPGGNNIQELALISCGLIHQLDSELDHFHIGVFLGTQFFRNIAKVRAAKLLVQKILDESHSKKTFSIVALTSYREWTLYERYSNLLRNDVSVASGLIAGAEHVQSAGYQCVHELEIDATDNEHSERSRRMARNTSHILALESMLGIVGDAAHGSFHLESLTQSLCEQSWELMQQLIGLSPKDRGDFMIKATAPMREDLRKQINTRKKVIAGINDYPDVKEHLHKNSKISSSIYRLGQDFEKLRFELQNTEAKPKVVIALYGDYSALNARMNFAKNYFELLGLEVFEPGHSVTDKTKFQESLKDLSGKILIVCSSDELYPELAGLLQNVEAKEKFIAGKFEVPGFANLFAGQNVYEVLSQLVQKWSKS